MKLIFCFNGCKRAVGAAKKLHSLSCLEKEKSCLKLTEDELNSASINIWCLAASRRSIKKGKKVVAAATQKWSDAGKLKANFGIGKISGAWWWWCGRPGQEIGHYCPMTTTTPAAAAALQAKVCFCSINTWMMMRTSAVLNLVIGRSFCTGNFEQKLLKLHKMHPRFPRWAI